MDTAQKGLYGFLGLCALVMGLYWIGDKVGGAPEEQPASIGEIADLQAARDQESARRQAEQQAAAEKQRRDQQVAAEERQREQALELAFSLSSDDLASVKSRLLDPYSAKFRDVWAVRGTVFGHTAYMTCGVVNSRNAFGAYTGEIMFVAFSNKVLTPEDRDFTEVFRGACLDGEKLVKMNP